MNINFNNIATQTLTGSHGGVGDLVARIAETGNVKVMPCRLQPGAGIGLHGHDGRMEVCYVLYGSGTAVCDGAEEALVTDICHICPAGSEHSIANTGNVELVMLTFEVPCPDCGRVRSHAEAVE